MENQEKIEEMKILDQKLHNLLLQKQNFQMELSETQAALAEVEKSGEEVFKIVGQLMIKTEKGKIKGELSDREKMLDLRIKTFEKQENIMVENLEKLRQEIMKK
tara:strand:- start:4313 stop:4624 length:312 start_codon:yes stop_codon:yes gene_type:complete